MAYVADLETDGLDAKATPVDADIIPIWDSVAGVLSRTTWAEAKAVLKTYNDGIYAPLASPTFTGTVTLPVGLTGMIKTATGIVSVATAGTDYAASNLDASLADGEYSGMTRTLAAKAAIAAGELVEYVSDTTLKFQKSDVSTDVAAVGICVAAAANPGDACKVLVAGRYRLAALTTVIAGVIYRHISTDGGIQTDVPAATGNKLQIIGFGDTDTDSIYFNPQLYVYTVA